MRTLRFDLRDAAEAQFRLTDTRTDQEFGLVQVASDVWEFEELDDDDMDALLVDLEGMGLEFEME